MTSSGMSPLVRCTCSACGRTFSSAKRWKVSRTSSKSSPKWRGPCSRASPARAAGSRSAGQELGRRCVPSGLDAPGRLAARHPAGQIGHDVGHEGVGQCGFDRAVGAVLEGGPGGGHGGGGVGHVVGHHLIGVDPAVGAHGGAGLVDQLLGQFDGAGGGGQIGGTRFSHGARPYWGGRRPMTVTSGRQDDRVVAGVDAGQRFQIARPPGRVPHWPAPRPRRR